MIRELKVDDEALAPEVEWLAKMPTTEPETAVIQVTSLLSAVMLRRTCFDRYQESVISAEGVGQASILVDALKLAAALKTVSGRLVISIDDGELIIKAGQRTVRLKTADGAVEFPQWPRFEGQGRGVVSPREMMQVLTSVGNDETIPILMTVAFDDGTMVTTDRFRLTAITYGTSGFVGKVASSTLRPFAKADTAVFIEAGSCPDDPNGWVELRSMGRTVTAPMPDTEFPQWRKLIPREVPVRVAVSKEALLKAVSGNEVTLTIDGETMTVVSESDGIQTEQEIKLFQTVRNDVDGPFTVTIRSKYVTEALRGLDSGIVLFEGSSSEKPVVFRDVADKELHLIMPVRKKAG